MRGIEMYYVNFFDLTHTKLQFYEIIRTLFPKLDERYKS